jgi:antitoxin component of MazEF toxin-antitoxin module
MVALVQKTTNGFVVRVPDEVASDWQLKDGSVVELNLPRPAPAAAEEAIRYASVEEALQAFRDTLPQHEAAYRELAK